jgi:lantibiotic leader peptide-processing serine protease
MLRRVPGGTAKGSVNSAVRRTLLAAVALSLPSTALVAVTAPSPAFAGPSRTYSVLYGSDAAAARKAVKSIGGTVVSENSKVGVATVRTSNARFLRDVMRQRALAGAVTDRAIGRAPQLRQRDAAIEKEGRDEAGRGRPVRGTTVAGADPLADLQWDMQMINATPGGSYRKQAGDRRVLVGVIDTGIDGSHPDIAPRFDRARSRNFTVDDPTIDGPCAEDPDGRCTDPADADENGHGTHVASTIASPVNGIGMSGVAPNVTIVNLRAGQDSGYFFLKPTVDALTYAGDIGVDVVNMSFYIDPWLYNCPDDRNPGITDEQRMEQRTIIAATQRALDYAHRRNVTLVGAGGNGHTDLGAPTKFDDSSPDYPPHTEVERTVGNECLDLPTEGRNVLSIYSVGPSGRKADYSNYGLEQASVAAPGGWFRDGLGTPTYRSPTNMILAAYPEAVGRELGDIDETGEPTNEFVLKSCDGSTCAYYQWIQGTSMAAPHAAGVVALIVSQYGTKDGRHRSELTMSPQQAEKILLETAAPHACPPGGVEDYTAVGRPASWTATCEGTTEFNGFYGHGIVDALAAVSVRGR